MTRLRMIAMLALTMAVVLFVLRNPFRTPPEVSDKKVAVANAYAAPSTAHEETRVARAAGRARPELRSHPVPSYVSTTGAAATDVGANMLTATTLRAPIIDAIRSDKLRGEQKRTAMVEAIRSSGESDEPWTAEAEDAFDSWTSSMPRELRGKIVLSEPRCYAAGCITDVTFPDAESHRLAARTFRSLTEADAGHGGRVQTPPEPQGSRLVTSWIMLRP
jgi:hypothetical protein